MPSYKVTLIFEGDRIDIVKKKVANLFGDDAVAYVNKAVSPNSRGDRFSDAEQSLEDCKSEVAQLKEELEEWQGNLPENLQGGTKNDELQEAIDALEELDGELQGISWPDVEFPGMF